ncbi:MAG TPA: ABC-F family ATP-binding cassette domain-containing protein [Alphaproteobacteria bacterium]|nr:ABC-F family ATP-binding cassette domain-containing protein [Alphaproteobacteria bacterium]
MLTISNLTYRIGARIILDDCSINVTDGWRVGVVGLNGAGKSTLFKLITGDLPSDGGGISLSTNQKLAMVRQDIPETDDALIDVVLAANTEMAKLWHDAETETDPNKIADIYQALADMDAYSAPAKAATLLTGLGFKESQLNEPFSSFSGGWQMRVMLASVLFVEPDFLLLDEPTNHLDLEAIMWLENYLLSYPHTLMVISHDRELLNKCVDHIIHVDRQKLTMFGGNYDAFEKERALRTGLQQKMFEKQQTERAHMQVFIDRFKAKASKAAQAQSRMKAMERMDLVDAVIADRAIKFNFPNPEKIPSPMISIQKADVGYVEGKPILRGVYESIDHEDRIALLGANGNGKSTMMKLIAGKLDVMSGELFRSGKLRIGYFSQHQTDELDMDSTPFLEMLRLMQKSATDVPEHKVRAKLGAFGFPWDLADNKISALSGGEKARLLFALMSFDAPHMLLLDEPTNHLDIDAREALVQALNNYEGAVVIVSHDPNMVERVADRLLLVKDGKCVNFDGDLEDYRNYTIQSRREERAAEKKAAQKESKSSVVNDTSPKADISPKNLSELKKKAEKAEKEIERLTKEKETLESAMLTPDFYLDVSKSTTVKAEYDRVIAALEQQEEIWLEAQVA